MTETSNTGEGDEEGAEEEEAEEKEAEEEERRQNPSSLSVSPVW